MSLSAMCSDRISRLQNMCLSNCCSRALLSHVTPRRQSRARKEVEEEEEEQSVQRRDVTGAVFAQTRLFLDDTGTSRQILNAAEEPKLKGQSHHASADLVPITVSGLLIPPLSIALYSTAFNTEVKLYLYCMICLYIWKKKSGHNCHW